MTAATSVAYPLSAVAAAPLRTHWVSPSRALRFVRDPIGFFNDVVATWGPTTRLSFSGFPRVVFTSDPAVVKEIFRRGPEWVENPGAPLIGPVVGHNSVLVAQGDEHKRLRQLLIPAFKGERMRALTERMGEAAASHVREWKPGVSFDVHPAAEEIALDVIISVVLGVEGERFDKVRATVKEQLNLVTADLMFVKPLRINLGRFTRWGRLKQLQATFEELMRAEIAERRAEGSDRGTVLDSMLAVRDDEGQPMDDIEIIEQAGTLLVAGHETTATGLAWAFLHVLSHPEVLRRTRAELDDIGSDAAAMASSTWLDAVCRESLRLGSVIPEAPRRVVKSFEAGGVLLEAGDQLLVALPSLHRRADIFEEPEQYRPERFLDRTYAPWEFAPFGGGVRKCLGWAFALQQMKIVLGTALGEWNMRLTDESAEPLARRRNLSVGPKGGVAVTCSLASGSRASGPSPTA